MKSKVYPSMDAAVADIEDGASILFAGFGPGTPLNLTRALHYQNKAKDLTFIANGVGGFGRDDQITTGTILNAGRVIKVIAAFTASTHPSRPSDLERLQAEGKVVAELTPQGSLAERIRAGGAGVPGFYTTAGVGTELAVGKEHRDFNGRTYIFEGAITADYAFIRAWKADTFGNLIFRRSQRNFNPIMATAAKCTIVEVEEDLVPEGTLDPDQIHASGIFVHRIVKIPPPPEGLYHMQVPNLPSPPPGAKVTQGKPRLSRDLMAARLGAEFQDGWIVNLGVGMPTMCSDYVLEGRRIIFHSENGVIGYGHLAFGDEVDHYTVNAGVQHVVLEPFAAIVHHSDAFGIIRKGLLDVGVLGSYEVAVNGDFANWKASKEQNGGGIGGAMDIASRAKRIFLMMEHTTREGEPRLLDRCNLAITAPGVVKLVMTDVGLFEPLGKTFLLKEIAPGWTPQEVQAVTGAPLTIAPDLKEVGF